MEQKTREKLSLLMKEVPRELRERLYKEEYATPAALHLAKVALKDGSISKKKKMEIKNILDSGMLSKKKKVIDPMVAKQIDDFLDGRLSALIKAGRIKDPKEDKEINEFKRSH